MILIALPYDTSVGRLAVKGPTSRRVYGPAASNSRMSNIDTPAAATAAALRNLFPECGMSAFLLSYGELYLMIRSITEGRQGGRSLAAVFLARLHLRLALFEGVAG